MDWPLFVSTFSLIFFAELPDKTAMATLLMAARGKPLAIFLGVSGAFVIQCLVAVSFGRLLGFLPERWVHLAAGLLFLGFAAHAWLQKEDVAGTEEEGAAVTGKLQFVQAAWKAFLVIFIAEWGDLTQIATASVAARYHEAIFTIFCASTLALWSVTAIAVVIGRKVGHVLHFDLLRKVSVVMFATVGIYFLVTWVR